jgi:hypothetical protein
MMEVGFLKLEQRTYVEKCVVYKEKVDRVLTCEVEKRGEVDVSGTVVLFHIHSPKMYTYVRRSSFLRRRAVCKTWTEDRKSHMGMERIA